MITIPLSLIWFIIIVVVIAIGLGAFAMWASFSLARKAVATREFEVEVRNDVLNEVSRIQHENDIMLWHRQQAIWEQEEQLGAIAHREAAVHQIEIELGRHAHDAAMQVAVAMHEISEDTVVLPPIGPD